MMSQAHLTLDQVNEHFKPKGFHFSNLEEDKSGFVNKTIFLDDTTGKAYVLRLCCNLPQFAERKTRNEVTAMKFFAQNCSAPVPVIFDFDCSTKNGLGFEYILMSRLDGAQLSSVIDNLSEQEVDKLMRELIDCFKGTWSLRFDKMGPLDEHHNPGPIVLMDNKGPFSTPSEMVDAKLTPAFFETIGARGTQKEHYLMQLKEPALKSLQKPTFICFGHSDLKFDNILYKDGHISGIVDFEWSGAVPIEQDIFGSDFYRLEKYREKFLNILVEKLGFDVRKAMSDAWEGNVLFLGSATLFVHAQWGLAPDSPFVVQWVGELEKLMKKYGIFDGSLMELDK